MKVLYEFHWDCGRMGSLDGLFIEERDVFEDVIGEELWFGEVLGKHSEIYGPLGKEDLTVKSEDQEFIAQLEEVFGGNHISGYNPLDYLPEEEEAEDSLFPDEEQ